MSRFAVSPLRYPGGKAKTFPMVSSLILSNGLRLGHYAEPYAGGCGLAINLLMQSLMQQIHINDLDRSVWAFWECVLNRPDELIDRIMSTEVTVDQWRREREVQFEKSTADVMDLGFSSFFLNRTSRSGIILTSGVIGGLGQTGRYKIDCRFNKQGLADRIKRIGIYRSKIHLYNMDALDFIDLCEKTLPQSSLVNIDPPYYSKGESLYTNHYQKEDHAAVAERVQNMTLPWMVTYDNEQAIRSLYRKRKQYLFNLNYSATVKRVGTELLVLSDDLIIPKLKLQAVA